jgi:hypothetical protein
MEPTNVILRSAATGAIDGAFATVVMTGAMRVAQRAGWLGELPPRRITRLALRRAGQGGRSRRATSGLAALAHVGFGAAAGSAFEVTFAPRGRPHGRGPLAGAAFGAAIWLVSYAGWVPALRLLPPPPRDRPGRQAALVLAHLVYGATLGALADLRSRPALRPPASPELPEVPSPS